MQNQYPKCMVYYILSYVEIQLLLTNWVCVLLVVTNILFYSLFLYNLTHAEYICYDDACYLKKYSNSATRRHLTTQSEKPASVNMVIDKMHMAGRVDKWCKENCDAKSFQELDKVSIYS